MKSVNSVMKYRKNAAFSLAIALLITATGPQTLFGYELDFTYTGAELVKKEADREVYRKKSGSMIYRYKEREEAHLSDGTKIIRFSNGKREVYPPDGVKITINYDGSIKYTYPDGKEKFISMDGFTPFGVKIISENRTIRRNKIRVNIIYSAEMSDDIMSKYVKKFYDELANHAQLIVYKKKIKGREIKIVLSNCRFGRTGYCRRNNRKGLDVIGYRDGKKEKVISVKESDIYDKKEYQKRARSIVEKILGK
jgi:hypothetical protein